ncbi:MAG TPA: hypothetical protein PKL87_09670 [Thermotogota bacterium]|jgi:hypothetical protein|nr:hypothetical protein [Thermotogota bacterium]HQK81967.1 hypothetical protein [Thermotogota bacterium]
MDVKCWFWKRVKKPKYITSQNELLIFYAQCGTCGELFRTIIRKNSELSQNFEQENTYEVHKELIGSYCPNRIHVHLWLSQGLKLLKQTVTGGILLTEEEYTRLKEEKNV